MRDHLPAWVRRSVHLAHVPGGRSADGSYPARQAATADAVRAYAVTRTGEVLARFATERSIPGGAVDGTTATLARSPPAGCAHCLSPTNPTTMRPPGSARAYRAPR